MLWRSIAHRSRLAPPPVSLKIVGSGGCSAARWAMHVTFLMSYRVFCRISVSLTRPFRDARQTPSPGCSPYRRQHVHRERVGVVHRSRAIFCRPVPSSYDSQLCHRACHRVLTTAWHGVVFCAGDGWGGVRRRRQVQRVDGRQRSGGAAATHRTRDGGGVHQGAEHAGWARCDHARRCHGQAAVGQAELKQCGWTHHLIPSRWHNNVGVLPASSPRVHTPVVYTIPPFKTLLAYLWGLWEAAGLYRSPTERGSVDSSCELLSSLWMLHACLFTAARALPHSEKHQQARGTEVRF
jgi:hypothetical protein